MLHLHFPPMPYPRLVDHLGVPGGVIPGAMENFGLATYDEDVLLFDPNNNNLLNERATTLILSHETANMVRQATTMP